MANTAQIITEISKITDKTVARFCLKTKTFFLNLCTKIKQWESFQLGTEKVEQSDHGSQSQWEFKVKISKLPKRGKTLLTKFRLVLLLRLIGWENSADFLDQLQSEVKRDQSNPRLFSTLNWNCSREEQATLYLPNPQWELVQLTGSVSVVSQQLPRY